MQVAEGGKVYDCLFLQYDVSVKCPYCATAIRFEEADRYHSWEGDDKNKGFIVLQGFCPECEGFIVLMERGKIFTTEGYAEIENPVSEELLFPKFANRFVEAEVPERFRKDFLEACGVLTISPKASAALSRRILQDVLRDQFGISKKNLADEIDEFLQLKDVPTFLKEAVDAIRQVGNFAAHPLKDQQTGSIVEVEPGEADWLLEVLESLFDFAFVQPVRLKERKDNLNAKLKALGKPSMKT